VCALTHDAWARDFPWLVQGTTTGDGPRGAFDLGLFAPGVDEEAVRGRWELLRSATGAECVVHARQLHGADVLVHTAASLALLEGEGGTAGVPLLADPADGHLTREAGVLLGVTTADCVPVFFVAPESRVVGAVHAGWRGVALGVLERSLSELSSGFATAAGDLHVHLGPAICGRCYEVGPEVFEALGLPAPPGPEPVDVRAVLAHRALQAGVRAERLTVSEHCTRCTGSRLFSHRAGDAQRQVGFIGLRASTATLGEAAPER